MDCIGSNRWAYARFSSGCLVVRLAFIKLPDWYVILQLIEAPDGRRQRKDGTALMADAVEDKPLGERGHALKAYNLKTSSRCRPAAGAAGYHN